MPKLATSRLVKEGKDKVKEYLPSWLVDAVAPDQPDLTDVMNPLGGPMVSIYKTLPERLAATQAFKDSIRTVTELAKNSGLNPSSFGAAAEKFAQRYPRVAAHSRLMPQVTDMGGALGMTISDGGKVMRPVSIVVNNDVIKRNSLPEAADTLFHEGTHVAQKLGNSQFDQLYSLMTGDRGYMANPFEINARRVGAKASVEAGERGVKVPGNMSVSRQIAELSAQPGASAEAKKAGEVVQRRSAIVPTGAATPGDGMVPPPDSWVKWLTELIEGKS